MRAASSGGGFALNCPSSAMRLELLHPAIAERGFVIHYRMVCWRWCMLPCPGSEEVLKKAYMLKNSFCEMGSYLWSWHWAHFIVRPRMEVETASTLSRV